MTRLKDLPDQRTLDLPDRETVLAVLVADERCPRCNGALFYDGAALRNGRVRVRLAACPSCEFATEF